LGARAACWQDQILLGSSEPDAVTLAHELVHAAQWLKYGKTEGWIADKISDPADPCEMEAEAFCGAGFQPADPASAGSSRAPARLAGRKACPTVTQPRSAELALYTSSRRLIMDCKITGHASPRWRGAPNDQERIRLNDVLARQRADAVAKYFQERLVK